ncbi:hypothetical protein E2C01_008713 [Portunus trituberculatus]|uniref:Uncharacterized protein n=1 Tax=Portunus trituberculatus TaxID=210409 RepID=A0A5B7D2Q0_PORTR|nr:hypothetical protein [Portunus trituberculatus]
MEARSNTVFHVSHVLNGHFVNIRPSITHSHGPPHAAQPAALNQKHILGDASTVTPNMSASYVLIPLSIGGH